MNIEIEATLNRIYSQKISLLRQGNKPKYVILSKPLREVLFAYNKHLLYIETEMEELNKLFGLEIIEFDRDDIFYLVG
jgi:hypothetical protein